MKLFLAIAARSTQDIAIASLNQSESCDMKFFVFCVLIALPITSMAACPAAPVGTANDPVIQMRLNADGLSAYGPANRFDATEEGAIVWNDAENIAVVCDGNDWIQMGAGNLPTNCGTGQTLEWDGADWACADLGTPTSAYAHVFLNSGTFSWTVPAGVTEVSVVCIGSGGAWGEFGESSSVARGAMSLCLAPGGGYTVATGIGDAVMAPASNNGDAALYSVSSTVVVYGRDKYGGTSLFGELADHSVPQYGTDRSSGSNYHGGRPGGGGRIRGGLLAYSNSISVTPGETLTVVIGAGAYSSGTTDYFGADGGVAITWGAGNYPQLTTIPTNVTYE